MEFKSNKGIYLQIADALCNQILEGKLSANDRAPSIRDLATQLEVNRNTVMRSFSYLQDQDILYNKRGIGFFISENAFDIITNKEKENFFENELPPLIKKIQLLSLNKEDLKKLLKEIENNENK